jgi:hypothetical protein
METKIQVVKKLENGTAVKKLSIRQLFFPLPNKTKLPAQSPSAALPTSFLSTLESALIFDSIILTNRAQNHLHLQNNSATFAPHFTNLDNFLAASMQAGRRENSFSFRV